MPAGCKVQARPLVSQTTQPKIRFPDMYFWMKWPEEVTAPLWPDRELDSQLLVGQQNATDLELVYGDGCRSKMWFCEWNLRFESHLMNKWTTQNFTLNFKAGVLSLSLINHPLLFLFVCFCFSMRALINFLWTLQACLLDTNQAIHFSGSQNGMQEKLIRFPLTSLGCGWATAG